MKPLNLILGALFFLILTGCAGSKATISEDWNWRPSTIAVIYSNPVVQNMDDVADDLPEYVISFPTWMTQELQKNIEAKVNARGSNQMRVEVVHYPSCSAGGPACFFMGESELLLDGKDFFANENDQFTLPEADVYLVLDGITIKNSQAITTGAGLLGVLLSYLMHSGDLFIEATYAFYDAKSHKRLGFGFLQSNEGYFFGVAKSTWEDLMKNAADDLLDETPLLK